MREVEVEGLTVDEAVVAALAELRAERDIVDVTVLREPSSGLLGIGRRPARVRVVLREDGDVSRETSTPDAPLVEARSVLDEVARQLAAHALTVDVVQDGDPGIAKFVVRGDDAALLIGRHGATLDAVEHILNRVASRSAKPEFRISVDVEGYRERRQESLEQLAHRMADKARRSGHPIELAPMSPRDRRLIHVALRDVAGIETQSEGAGQHRRVVIHPVGRQHRRPG